MGKLANQMRIEQTCRELTLLQDEIQIWLEKRREKDKQRQQYHTQLKVLDKALLGPLKIVQAKLGSIDDSRCSGEVYAVCRGHDERILRVRRVWTYFQEKFDQREDLRLQKVLEAADEVTWSCYTEVFRNLKAYSPYKVERGPVPLPYIEALYSPQARPRDNARLPDLLPDTTDEVLYEYLSMLPVPVISLPPICVREPWWLVYLGHEVGHHLQHDLVPELGLVRSFGELLQTTAQNGPEPVYDPASTRRWKGWREEIFADLCSVFSMGTWAIRAIAELELADRQKMFANNNPYPPALVRLELLAQIGDALGLDGHGSLGELQPVAQLDDTRSVDVSPGQRQMVIKDIQALPKMVAAMLDELSPVGRFAEMYRWRINGEHFRKGGKVLWWAQELAGQGRLNPDQALHTPRILASAALAAWMKVTATTSSAAQRDNERKRLSERLLPTVIKSREPGVRATPAIAEPDTSRLAERVADLLFQKIA